MADLCEYEKQRLEHIRRNHEMLVRLGLVDTNSKPLLGVPKEEKKPAAAAAKKPRLPAAPPETLRRSGRVRGAKPEYTKEIVDSFGDDDLPDGAAKKKRRRAEESDDDDEDAERDAMLAAASEFLRAAREAMEQYDGETPSSAEGWHAKALQRWGDHAGKHAAGEERDWETFVTSRLSTPPPPSPHDLLQEYYAADAWQLLCCCILMSRCSSWQTKHRCISGFFEAYPTPSAFWQSVVLSAEADGLGELNGIVHSLGLFDDRLKGLRGVTEAFLFGRDDFDVDPKTHKTRGIGEFGHHSFLIFCRDAGASLKANDCALKTFCSWRRKEQQGAAVGASAE